MMQKLRFAPLLLGALVLGCQNIPMPTNGNAPGAVQRVEYGYLRITIRWPRQTQTLPANTQSIKLRMTDSQDNPVMLDLTNNRNDLVVTKSGSEYRTAVMVPKGTGYKLEGWAYSVLDPLLNDPQPIASGCLLNVEIKANEMTQVPLQLVPTGYPVIASLDKSNGGYGSTIVITGSSFWPDAVVWFDLQNGSTTSVSPSAAVSSTSISVLVPNNADNGTLTVKSNGVLSNESTLFKVINGIAVSPASPTILANQTQTFTATVTDPSGATVTSPNYTWTSSVPAVGSISALGLFTPLSAGSSTIRATSGNVYGSATIQVNPVPTPTPSYQPGSLNMPAGNAGGINGSLALPSGQDGGTNATLNLPGGQNGSVNVTFPMPAGNAGAANP